MMSKAFFDRRSKMHLKNLLGLALVGAAFVLLLGLGFWQLERKTWKEGLIGEMQKRVERPAIDFPRDITNLQDLKYQPVRLTGTFYPQKAILLSGRSYRGRTGIHVFVPMEVADGRVVFVNRGWMPQMAAEKVIAALKSLPAEAEIQGILRLADSPQEGALSPKNDPEKGFWVWPDIAAFFEKVSLAQTSDAPVITRLYIEENLGQHEGRYPIAGQTTISLPNNHLQYAITWFSLAVALVVVTWIYIRRHHR